MSSVLIGSAMEIMGARLALAGTSDSWPNGACERTYIYDHELNMDRPEMVCWTNDWSLSVPEPRVP